MVRLNGIDSMKRRTTPDQPSVLAPLALSTRQAAKLANVGTSTLLAAIAAGQLRAKCLGRTKFLIRPADLEDWIDNLEDAKSSGAK